MKNYKIVCFVLGGLNGGIYVKLTHKDSVKFIKLSYCTPLFNDYGEWRISFDVIDKFDETQVKDKNQYFNIDLDTINFENLFNELNKEYDESCDDNYNWDDIIIYSKYRAPTEEEMISDRQTLKDYNIGEFLTQYNLEKKALENFIRIEKFKPQNEIENVCFQFLKTILENSDLIFKSERTIYLI